MTGMAILCRTVVVNGASKELAILDDNSIRLFLLGYLISNIVVYNERTPEYGRTTDAVWP